MLTRLPAPHRARPASVIAFLEASFDADWLTLSGPTIAKVVKELAERGITGGATYDGLIGVTARTAGVSLYSCDRRALPVYNRLGVEVQFVG